jgi:hypothetical protein
MSRSLESHEPVAVSRADRPTVIFMHIPKTGGLTLGDIMLREYGRGRFEIVAGRGPERREAQLRFLETGEPVPAALPAEGPIERFLQFPAERRARLRAIMGHFPFGIHEALDRPFTYLTLVRDPVDRVLSAYAHRVFRQKLDLSLEDYIRSERDPALHSSQVRRIAGRRRRERPGPDALDEAKRNIEEHFAVVGLTDRFDESLLLAARRFGWRKIAYRRQNEGRARPRREDLAPDLLRILERANELDRELLEFARERLQRQLDASGMDVERELARLRRRSSLYRWIAPRQARTGPDWKRHPVERPLPPSTAR